MEKPCFHVSSISCFLCWVFISSFFINSLVSLTSPRPDQIEILLAFKNEFPILKCDFLISEQTKSWTSKDAKSFDGVVFDSETGVVTELDLSGACLSGSLSANSSLFRLHHLRYLLLSDNYFDSFSFLPGLGKLTNLEFLDLSYMGLVGEIPSSISSLNRLTKLNLYGNELIGSFSPLLNLSKLSSLDLSENHFSGNVPLPKWLLALPSLRGLFLSHNSLDGIEGSPKMLLNSSLAVLDLRSNAFKGSLPLISPGLCVVLASNNSFTGDIPLSLCNQSYIPILDLSHNNFSGSIPHCLFTMVKDMDLRNNNLTGTLPEIFDKTCSMTTLDFSHNQITGKLPRSLTNCGDLKVLNMEGNRIADTFPFWLKDLPNLKVMVLRSNMFHGPIYSPQHPLSFPHLQIVDISRNKFTGRLPHDYFVNWSTTLISTPQEETELYYMGEGTMYDYYPSMYLRNKGINMELEKILDTYTAIDFSENKLGGQIPESIGLLKSLIVLDLSSNDFSGHIPSSWANLTSLESLDLSRNQLSGKIPQELATLSFLEYINVSHNQLTGQIPHGTRFGGQPSSSFEGNLNLCGLPLKSCFSDKVPSTPEAQEPESSEQEQVVNWKAAAIGYGPGVLFGLAIGQVFYSYKPVLFFKLFRF
uniref:Leucine-rich repeat-containing N-terminal plant-type domain-containing protein n=1 Tax=Brassica oleracea TaxID=3712 RepID=A0A3P6GU89_BRAOL|nr:unnamed protein product [Brassica oleracea]